MRPTHDARCHIVSIFKFLAACRFLVAFPRL
jgi:hypothetical protein